MPFAFNTFLSHRYKSPEVNLFFFKLFDEIAEVQFEIDEGTFATNVTRLERMIRAADAFIGIYPFPGSWESAQQPEELKKASRYFRLELDLAIRSRKPAIIFYDEKYGSLLRCPNNILAVPFNIREISGSGQAPKAKLYKDFFRRFRDIVTASMAYERKQADSHKTLVGIALPPETCPNGYTAEDIQIIEAALEKDGYEDRRILKWPFSLNRDAFTLFHQADWMIVDTGDEMAKTGIPAYLHGRFVPMMRLRHVPSEAESVYSPLERSLFGDVEVGYNKDIVVWSDRSALEKGLQERLFSLRANVRRISNLGEAETYFRSAALRKEAVFLSYSGRDRDIAADISTELKKHFQTVFDYRDGKSIRPGADWIDEIFQQLSASAIGIPLLSEDYFASQNCMHEAKQMVAHHDSGKMKVVPIKLYEQRFTPPPWLESIQYLRFTDYGKAEGVVKEVVNLT